MPHYRPSMRGRYFCDYRTRKKHLIAAENSVNIVVVVLVEEHMLFFASFESCGGQTVFATTPTMYRCRNPEAHKRTSLSFHFFSIFFRFHFSTSDVFQTFKMSILRPGRGGLGGKLGKTREGNGAFIVERPTFWRDNEIVGRWRASIVRPLLQWPPGRPSHEMSQ